MANIVCVCLDQIYPHHVSKCLTYTKAYHQIISAHGPLGSDLLRVGWILVCSTNICSCWQCIVLCVIRHYFTKSFDKVTNSKNEKLRLRYALIVRSSIWTNEPHHLAPSFAPFDTRAPARGQPGIAKPEPSSVLAWWNEAPKIYERRNPEDDIIYQHNLILTSIKILNIST